MWGSFQGTPRPGRVFPVSWDWRWKREARRRRRCLAPGRDWSREQKLGPYRIVRVLGEGGMGIVYLADQSAPVQRQVAIKVIKLGLDTEAVLARFEAEQQAMAVMEHECIARLYEAGQTPEGRPYFVMEYVDGEPISEYCDRKQLGMEQRLELFIKVCSAVQHAHQKGIVHRDLKPTNVLVSEENGLAVPTVIDFGIAKATERQLTERSLYTEAGILLGTPEYMSPEQAAIHPLAVDTRTDVYSLGVMLYELLTGVLPFDPKELRAAAFDEIRRRVREELPSKPSTRVDSLGPVARITATRRRRPSTASLRRELAGDLDRIAMKALEKDPDRRYASPSEFAADVGRHLRREPVLAQPPSTLYQLRKLIARNPLAATIFGAFVLTAIGVSIAMTLLYRQSQSNLTRALSAETEAQQVSEFLVGVFEVSDPDEARGNSVTARELLDSAAEKIAFELEDQPRVQATMIGTMGRVYRSLGLYEQASTLFDQALEQQRGLFGESSYEIGRALVEVARSRTDLGQLEEAETEARAALEMLRVVDRDDSPEVAETLQLISQILWRRGRPAEGIPLAEQALAIFEKTVGAGDDSYVDAQHLLANLYLAESRYEEAEELFQSVIDYQRQIYGDAHTKTSSAMLNLAETYKQMGRYDDAEPLYLKSLEIDLAVRDPDHPVLAFKYNNLGTFYSRQKKWAEAETQYLEALRIRKASLPPDHPMIAWTYSNLAMLYLNWEKYDEAEPMFDEALRIAEIAVGSDSTDYVIVISNLSILRRSQKRYDEAEALLRRALGILERIGSEQTMTASNTWFGLAKTLEAKQDWAGTAGAYEKSLVICREKLGDEHPDTVETLELLEAAREKLGN